MLFLGFFGITKMAGDMEMVTNDLDERKLLDSKKRIEFRSSSICCVQECQSKYAENICLFDLSYKFLNSDEYDLGGTYSDNKPDLWFYMTTWLCPGNNYLLNLFVCQRNVGFVSLGISNSNELKTEANGSHEEYAFLPEELTWKTLKASKSNESHYIKTFVFNKSNDLLKKRILLIPIRIQMHSGVKLNNVIVDRVQAQHNIYSLIKKEKTDYTFVTKSNRKYDVHKIVICTRSSELKEMIKNSDKNTLELDINDEDAEVLIEYLYLGKVRQIMNRDKVMLLELAMKFKLTKLYVIVEQAIKEQINIDNVLDIAKLSQKYNLKDVENSVFKFIKENRQVLQSDAWKNLDDIALTKKLFEHLYFESCL